MHEKKKKILLVHNYYRLPGGEDTVVENEKKLLEDHGHEVIMYSRSNTEIDNMRSYRKMLIPFMAFFNIKTFIDIKKIIKEKKIDIVHVHNILHLISPAVYYAAILNNVPVIQTIHNFRLLCPGATFFRDGKICEDCITKGKISAIIHKCYRKSRLETIFCLINNLVHNKIGIFEKLNYICLTDFNKNKLSVLKFINERNVYVKPNFTYSVCKDKRKRRDGDYYLFIGRIEEIKGVKLLIDAFLAMPEKKLLLAGDGPLRNELEKIGAKNIKFLGKVKHESVLEMIADARAVILPSQCYEGFPMTILEAMSEQTPVIASNIGNNGILIRDMINGLKFQYDSKDDLIKVISRLENSDYEHIGFISYKTYLQKYTPDANYKQLMLIYNKVCQKEVLYSYES